MKRMVVKNKAGVKNPSLREDTKRPSLRHSLSEGESRSSSRSRSIGRPSKYFSSNPKSSSTPKRGPEQRGRSFFRGAEQRDGSVGRPNKSFLEEGSRTPSIGRSISKPFSSAFERSPGSRSESARKSRSVGRIATSFLSKRESGRGSFSNELSLGELPLQASCEEIAKLAELQHAQMLKSTAEEKLEYAKGRLESFRKMMRERGGCGYINSKNIEIIIPEGVLLTEAWALFKLSNSRFVAGIKYAFLQKAGLQEILLFKGVNSLNDLFLAVFGSFPSDKSLEELKKYFLEYTMPLCTCFNLGEHNDDSMRHALEITSIGNTTNLTPEDLRTKGVGIDSVEGVSSAELRRMRRLAGVLISSKKSHIQMVATLTELSERSNEERRSMQYVDAFINLLSVFSAGVQMRDLLMAVIILDIHHLHEFSSRDADAVIFLASQGRETLQDISLSKYFYQLSKYGDALYTHQELSITESLKELTPEQISYYEKVKAQASLAAKQAISSLKNGGGLSYESFNPIEVVEAIEVAICYGVTCFIDVNLTPSLAEVFGQDEYACYIRLADAVSVLDVTPLEVAKRMVDTLGNGNDFGYLDLFSLRMLESVGEDSQIIRRILNHTSERVAAAEKIPAPAEIFRCKAMLKAASENLPLAVGMKLQEILENVKLHAKIIGYEELEVKLKIIPSCSGSAEKYVSELRLLIEDCKNLILSKVKKNTVEAAVGACAQDDSNARGSIAYNASSMFSGDTFREATLSSAGGGGHQDESVTVACRALDL